MDTASLWDTAGGSLGPASQQVRPTVSNAGGRVYYIFCHNSSDHALCLTTLTLSLPHRKHTFRRARGGKGKEPRGCQSPSSGLMRSSFLFSRLHRDSGESVRTLGWISPSVGWAVEVAEQNRAWVEVCSRREAAPVRQKEEWIFSAFCSPISCPHGHVAPAVP